MYPLVGRLAVIVLHSSVHDRPHMFCEPVEHRVVGAQSHLQSVFESQCVCSDKLFSHLDASLGLSVALALSHRAVSWDRPHQVVRRSQVVERGFKECAQGPFLV